MASLEIAENNRKGRKRLSTRVDLTPMVDLGFLLITFFMYTTTMAKPKTMEVNMPFVEPDNININCEIPQSTALTVILGKNHSIYSYEGMESAKNNILQTSFNATKGIRNVIIAKQRKIDSLQRQGLISSKNQLSVLIKPTKASTYNDLVNILDEMNINEVKVYAIVAPSIDDLELVH